MLVQWTAPRISSTHKHTYIRTQWVQLPVTHWHCWHFYCYVQRTYGSSTLWFRSMIQRWKKMPDSITNQQLNIGKKADWFYFHYQHHHHHHIGIATHRRHLSHLNKIAKCTRHDAHLHIYVHRGLHVVHRKVRWMRAYKRRKSFRGRNDRRCQLAAAFERVPLLYYLLLLLLIEDEKLVVRRLWVCCTIDGLRAFV